MDSDDSIFKLFMQQNLQHKIITNASQILLAVMFLFCGGTIYLLFRSKTLYIYQWCITLGISDFIDSCRYIVHDYQISEFVKFSLPDGLYCAAYILFIEVIWDEEKSFIKYFIISLVPIIAICSEILQFYDIVQGTFDVRDLICYIIPPLIYIVIKITNQLKFKYMKKYLYSIIVMAIFAIGFAASGDSSLSDSKSDYVGTYIIEGDYKLVINADKTARFYTPNGLSYAASVREHSYNDYITIEFGSSYDDWPRVKHTKTPYPVIDKNKHYFYLDASACRAKDENKRLSISNFNSGN